MPLGIYTYRQRWVSPKLLRDIQADADSDHERCQIRLADTLDVPRAIENLIHETVEACNAKFDLGMSHVKITALAMGLAQMLRPVIRKWW